MPNTFKIKEMPDLERPTEKLLLYGASSLSNNELLAVLLRSGTKGQNVLFLSAQILMQSGGLDKLLNSNQNDLISIKGIGRVKAAQMLALGEVCRRYMGYKTTKALKVTSPTNVVDIFMEEMRVLNKEYLKVIVLDTKKNIITIKDISIGSLNSSIVHPREVFIEAIKAGGDSIVICHNHPSGDPTPSKNDIQITRRLHECGKLMGIELVDHIIIGDRKYESLKERGLI